MIEVHEPKYLTICDVPEGTARQHYWGFYLEHAGTCLRNNCEDNAASWIRMDEGWNAARPVAGTLEFDNDFIQGRAVISYIDARDVAKQLIGLNGEGI